MLKDILTEEDKQEIKMSSMQKFDLLCKKLKSDNTLNFENISEFDENKMSEISVEDEIDCSSFVKNIDKLK